MPFYRKTPAGALLAFPKDMRLPLIVSVLDVSMEVEGRTTAALMELFGYQDERERLDIEVPSCFRTDFASIPAWARGLFPPFGRHAKAAVLHDWLYAIGEPGRKAVADRVFRHAMTELRVPAWRVWVMYWAVRLGGGAGYARAATDWASSFADGETGDERTPLFDRASAFLGQPHGPRPI
ncbi:MAG: DUF1353 domain-containing protein [Caulobacteraceae bacterium]|nr:DUF1353 domain-containing protein [Caulobacteraceae bacterium]